jgi:hypothetical protein
MSRDALVHSVAFTPSAPQAPSARDAGWAPVTLELPDAFVEAFAERVAARLAERLRVIAPPESSPWMSFEEAVRYTKIPAGTFRKLSAAGTFTAHGSKRKVYHRHELDAALQGSGRRPRVPRALVGTMG